MTFRQNLGELKRSLQKPKNMWSMERLEQGAMKQYEKVVGCSFDLNNPVLFSEKIVWYKLHYLNSDIERVLDKFLFKEYVREKIGEGYTIPLYGAWETVEEMRKDWSKLPEEFCLKSTLMSDGRNIKMVHEKKSIDLDTLCKEVTLWLKPYNTLINSYCRGYYHCTPRVLAEKYEENISGQLFDYKAYCFNGSPFTICASVNHFLDEHYPITYNDLYWNKINVKSGVHKNDDIPAPAHLCEMIEISKKLSEGFPFVRVDFFDTPEHLYVAELTLYPGGGLFKYNPESFNKAMGDLFILPK